MKKKNFRRRQSDFAQAPNATEGTREIAPPASTMSAQRTDTFRTKSGVELIVKRVRIPRIINPKTGRPLGEKKRAGDRKSAARVQTGRGKNTSVNAPMPCRRKSAMSEPMVVKNIKPEFKLSMFDEALMTVNSGDLVAQLHLLSSRFQGGSALPSVENITFAYALASLLAADSDTWQQFAMDSFWKSRRKRPRDFEQDSANALAHVIRFLYGSSSGSSGTIKRALNLLTPYWDVRENARALYEILAREPRQHRVRSKPLSVSIVKNDLSEKLLSSDDPVWMQVRLSDPKNNGNRLLEVLNIDLASPRALCNTDLTPQTTAHDAQAFDYLQQPPRAPSRVKIRGQFNG